MSAPKQSGEAVVIGFGDLSISGYFAEDGVTYEKSYDDTQVLKDQSGNTRTKVRMDPRKIISGTFMADLDSNNTVDGVTFEEGDTVSITDVAGETTVYEVQSASSAMAANALRITMTLIKEDSMTYTVA